MIIVVSLYDVCRVVYMRHDMVHVIMFVAHIHNPAEIVKAGAYDHARHRCCITAGQSSRPAYVLSSFA